MKKFRNFLVGCFIIFSCSSCEDYLDVQPTVDVSEQQLFKNLSGLEVVLNGMYKYMMTASYGTGNGIFGMQQYNLTSSPDLWVTEVGNLLYFSSVFQSVRTESGGAPANRAWEYNYTLINHANIILENVDNYPDQPELAAEIRGQALAVRGWAYFNLVRYYQQTFSIAKNEPGVPIYLDRATPERDQKDRASVQAVYDQVLSDLNGSLGLLEGWNRPSMEYINEDIVNGILAQVHLTMENWSEAANHAQAARTNYSLMSGDEYRSGFDVANSEWMWGFRQTENDNIQRDNLFSIWNFNQHRPAGTVPGGEMLKANENFVELFDENDFRNQFFYIEGGILNSGWASNKFRDDDTNYLGDMIVMRAAEMLLIEAEALAKQGRDSEALSLLNDLQAARNVENPTAGTGEIFETIWIERRKELYSEGLIFWDLLRLQKDLVKAGDARDQFTIPARSYRFILQIPDNELNFGGISVQNPLDGIYN